MSGKSIYVMDTPKACDECPLSFETEEKDTIICRGCEKYSINPKCTERPDWCPLKEVPCEVGESSKKKIIDDVIAERDRQDEKWGEQDHSAYVWASIIGGGIWRDV
ncbi:MAG: hypothetical protein J1F42_01760 [Lachnospiraceae bacterium]|nr:hypothetical protein [Lachnospiraceae bacterium]